jgi:sterol desaturase/sphingolipid hydroxylase (fatty acid hydroxylase superfamily)
MPDHQLTIVTTSILFVWLALIIAWERVAPYRKGLPFFREGFWTDFAWYTLIQSYLLKIVIFDFIIYPLQQHLHTNGLQFVSHWPVWCQVIFFLFTHDLYIYCFHRLQHANKFLWRTHEAHHSGKQVDFLSGSRSHAVEILINQTIEFAPIVLLGASPEVIPIKALLDAMFGTFIHANIRVKMGRLKYFINSPELHLWHHANYKEVFHANFSTKFSVWDYLFGTVYDPGTTPGDRPEHWGLGYDYPKDYFLQHAYSVRRFPTDRLEKNRWWSLYLNRKAHFTAWLKRIFATHQKRS